MADESTTQETSSAQESTGAGRTPRRRGSRRATTGVVTPSASAEGATHEITVHTTFSSRPQATPERDPEQQVDVLAAFGLGEAKPATKPAAKAAAKRSTSKVAQEESPAAEQTPEQSAGSTSGQSSETAEKPATTRAPRRRASRSAQAPKVEATQPTAAPEQAGAPEKAPVNDGEADDPRLPATALLFQAPAKRKRKKVEPKPDAAASSDADAAQATQGQAPDAPQGEQKQGEQKAAAKKSTRKKSDGAGEGGKGTKGKGQGGRGKKKATEQPDGETEQADLAEQSEQAAQTGTAADAAADTSTGEVTPEAAEEETAVDADEATDDDSEGADSESDDAEDSDSDDADSDDADSDDESDSDASDGEGSDGEGSGQPRKRRRRRGGRGRKRGGSGGGSADDSGAGQGGNQQGGNQQGGKAQGGQQGDQASGSEDAGSNDDTDGSAETKDETDGESSGSSSRRRRRRRGRRSEEGDEAARARDEVTALKGSTRLEAKRMRRREGRDAGRRRHILTEAEFLARRESVERSMVVRQRENMTQIAVLEDGVLVEHYVAQAKQTTMVGNVYLGRVQNVLPSMEAAFVDLGRGRNAVLYAGEVNWEAAGLDGQPRRIEQALKSGDQVLVQVTKDPIGHKGARLTSQITLAGRYLVLVPSGAMTGISRKLPDNERARLKKLLKEIVPEGQGVIVRTAAEGASEDELRRDVERLTSEWESIQAKASGKGKKAPLLLKSEPELALRVVRDVFNEDFASLTVAGEEAWATISEYLGSVAPDLAERLTKWAGPGDVFASTRIDEQLAKGMDRKVYLPSGGSLVIDRTEAMTVVDVNTGKFTGSGGTLEETVTKNNLEAAEEIVRQLRLRDIGGIIVVDFIDMVLESNRDLVLRRLIECLARDRTRHQVAEVTSLGLVQMTRKRVGQGLVEAFSTPCEHCKGRGFITSSEPHAHVETEESAPEESGRSRGGRRRSSRGGNGDGGSSAGASAGNAPEPDDAARAAVKATLAQIAAAAQHAHDDEKPAENAETGEDAESGEGVESVVADDAAPAEPAPVPQAEQAEASQPAEVSDAVVPDSAEAAPAENEASETEDEPADQEASTS
ncbi:Rne/Rng family ribonuclease [Serinibacter salmoneus]|uniref:Ribonuclease E n=1 Tax=Serinibacter salmoneus TaxID=556530 RepID=A0A2A9D2N8_9MICO|nr:Rne/Rng family ribonuclease [Serinibacter salmoneus]PFG20120.1 RNAse G [Serinibacter salmoneus]